MAWNTELPTARTYWQSRATTWMAWETRSPFITDTNATDDSHSITTILKVSQTSFCMTANKPEGSTQRCVFQMHQSYSLQDTKHIFLSDLRSAVIRCLPCVLALAASRQEARPRSEHLPSSHCWTWLNSWKDTRILNTLRICLEKNINSIHGCLINEI